MTVVQDTMVTVTGPDMRERLAAGERVVVMVPDAGDPCGTRRIARVVIGSYAADVWDRELNRWTVGRWMLALDDGMFITSCLLVTAASHPYAVAELPDGPVISGPCEACVRHTAAMAREATARDEAARAAGETPEEKLAREARDVGHTHGWNHANYVDNVGASGWSVPVRFEDVAEHYVDAFEEGMTEFRNGNWDDE